MLPNGKSYSHRTIRNVDGSFWCQHCKQNLFISRATYYRKGHNAGLCIGPAASEPPPPQDFPPLFHHDDQPAQHTQGLTEEDSSSANDSSQEQYQGSSNSNHEANTDEEGEELAAQQQMMDALRAFFLQTTGTFEAPPNAPPTEYSAPTKNTLWYQERCYQPLYPGCQVSLIQAIYVLLTIRQEKMLSDVCFDMMLRFASFILPEGHLLPSSLYLLLKIVEVEDISEYEWHLCECGQHTYGKCKPADYHKHIGDRCPVCSKPRFKKVAVGKKTTYKPNAVSILQCSWHIC